MPTSNEPSSSTGGTMKVTDEVRKMAALAANASMPMGMGFIQWKPGHEFKPEDFDTSRGELYLDYVQGRMVKLSLARDPSDGLWAIPTREPRADYQSWCNRYPTYQALAEAAQSQ